MLQALLAALAAAAAAAAAPCYDVESVSINKEPVISYLAGSSDFGFA